MQVAKAYIAALPPSAGLVATKDDSNDLRALTLTAAQGRLPAKTTPQDQFDCDANMYKQRNTIKRIVCRFKDWHRVAVPFDRNIKPSWHHHHRRHVVWWL